MQLFCVSGQSWSPWGTQVNEFTLGFPTETEAKAAINALRLAGEFVYVNPEVKTNAVSAVHQEAVRFALQN